MARPSKAVLAERILHERELREASERASALALQVQAAEYGRRLDNLNHEHERSREAQRTSVTRELFDARIGPLESRGARFDGGTAALMAILTIAGVVAGLVIGALR